MSAHSLVAVLGDAASIMTPLLFAALGGLFTELSGTLNIALEGLISTGAFFAAAAAGTSRNLVVGTAAGIAAAALVSALYGAATQKLKANEFIAGLATNLLASGMTIVLSQQIFKTKGVISFAIPSIPRPAGIFRSLPLLGELVFRHDLFAYLGWAAVPLTWLAIAKTPFGMRLRASGSSPDSIAALGLKPERYRFWAAIISGAACGLAGSSLSLGLSAYVPNIASGRGWIALVAIYLGRKRPAGIFAACLLFAVADSFANYAQGFLNVPPDFILALPYLVSLIALIAGAAMRKVRGSTATDR